MGESNDSVGHGPAHVIWLYAATPKTALILVTIILVSFFTMNQTLLSSFGTPFERVEMHWLRCVKDAV